LRDGCPAGFDRRPSHNGESRLQEGRIGVRHGLFEVIV
jgi:hypothetical protein